MLPEWVAARLGLEQELSAEDIEELKSRGYAEAMPGLSWASLVAALLTQRAERIEFVKSLAVPRWRFGRVVVGQDIECELVEIPSLPLDPQEVAPLPPTDAERLLATAWLFSPEADPSVLQTRFADHVLLVWYRPISADSLSGNAVMAVAAITPFRDLLPSPGSCRDKALLVLDASAELRKDEAFLVRLIEEALAQTNPSLKCLFFYRVFERAYLRAALQKFDGQFLSDPKAAVTDVTDLLKSERNRLISLVGADSDTKDWFVLIYDECIRLENSGNRFITSVSRSCKADGWMTGEIWQQGCSLFYKIRCSIAHSGTSGPVYEAFPDSRMACEALLPFIEQSALQYLGIRSKYFL